MKIKASDAKLLNYCTNGIRAWFAQNPQAGTFREFVLTGIEEEKLAETGDHFAIRLIAFMKEKKEQNGRT